MVVIFLLKKILFPSGERLVINILLLELNLVDFIIMLPLAISLSLMGYLHLVSRIKNFIPFWNKIAFVNLSIIKKLN